MNLSLLQRCLLLQVLCQDTYLVSLVLEILLNVLTFIFLTTSGTDNLAQNYLYHYNYHHIYLQEYCKDKTVSLLLMSIITSFALHS